MAEKIFYHALSGKVKFDPRGDDLYMYTNKTTPRNFLGGLTDSMYYAQWHAKKFGGRTSQIAVYKLPEEETERMGLIPGFADENASSYLTVYRAPIQTLSPNYLHEVFKLNHDEAERILGSDGWIFYRTPKETLVEIKEAR